MEIGSVTSLITSSLGLLLALLGGFRYITAQDDSLRREIEAAKKEAALLVEKAAESEAKQRHSASNAAQIFLSKIELELRTLQREAVRHEQMQALEQRLNGALSKIEMKVDRMAEGMGEIIAIRTKLDAVLVAMSRINDKLDDDDGVRRNTRVA